MSDHQAAFELLSLRAELPPLRRDEAGTIRVGTGRITLDLIVEQYENGMTPEDMVRAYEILVLAEVYGVIAYYLQHREAVRDYMKRRSEQAALLQAQIERERPRVPRQELLTRRDARDQGVVFLPFRGLAQ